MTTDTRIAMPPANYKVTQVNVGNRRHYEVTADGKETLKMPGVTGTLGIIAKPQLIPWATNQGIASVVASLLANSGTLGVMVDLKEETAWIANALKAAKKDKKNLVAKLSAALQERYIWPKKPKVFKINPLVLANIIETAADAPDTVKDDAADIGSIAHHWFDLYCQGKAPPIDEVLPAARPSIERFLNWVENSGLVIAAGETMVASLRYGYGGELDAVFSVDDPSKTPARLELQEGDLVIGDYKTSNGIYDEYAFQVSAYDQAFTETFGIKCRAGVIVRFGKDQPKDKDGNLLPLEFETMWLADPALSFRAFLAARDLQMATKGTHFIE